MIKKATRVFSLMFVTLVAALLLSMSISAAHAAKPIPVQGQIIVQGTTNIVPNPAGESDNSIVTLSLYGVFVGDIAGSYTSESRWVRHDVGTPGVWTNIHAIDTISPATVMDKTGTLTFMLNGKTGQEGTWVIVGGTGELANLRGQGTYSQANAVVVNYEGQVHFDS
jgi:uncharacterized membrane protein